MTPEWSPDAEAFMGGMQAVLEVGAVILAALLVVAVLKRLLTF